MTFIKGVDDYYSNCNLCDVEIHDKINDCDICLKCWNKFEVCWNKENDRRKD